MSAIEYYAKLTIFNGEARLLAGEGPIGTAALQQQVEGNRAVAISREAYFGNADHLVAGIRAGIWAEVKMLRDAAIDGGANTPAGRVQTDPLSRSNITGAVVAAMLAQQASSPFSVDWTLADNSVVTLDAAAVTQMGLAVVAHVDAAHASARALRNQIEATSDPIALLQIDTTAGWPA